MANEWNSKHGNTCTVIGHLLSQSSTWNLFPTCCVDVAMCYPDWTVLFAWGMHQTYNCIKIWYGYSTLYTNKLQPADLQWLNASWAMRSSFEGQKCSRDGFWGLLTMLKPYAWLVKTCCTLWALEYPLEHKKINCDVIGVGPLLGMSCRSPLTWETGYMRLSYLRTALEWEL